MVPVVSFSVCPCLLQVCMARAVAESCAEQCGRAAAEAESGGESAQCFQ